VTEINRPEAVEDATVFYPALSEFRIKRKRLHWIFYTTTCSTAIERYPQSSQEKFNKDALDNRRSVAVLLLVGRRSGRA
jgi:hypothetical protein